MMLDSKLLSENEPIDLSSLCATNHYHLDPYDNCYGVHLTDEGLDCFKGRVNIEVQHASEQVIAAVERNGGTITTAYYDLDSVIALFNPMKFFAKGGYLLFDDHLNDVHKPSNATIRLSPLR